MKIIRLAKLAIFMAALLALNCLPVRAAILPQGSTGSGSLNLIETAIAPTDSTHGSFRIECRFSHMNTDDAIAHPGEPNATHLHAYFGNTISNAETTYQSLTSTGNSTCHGGIANRSSYWVPAMLDKNGTPIPPNQFFLYYKSFDLPHVKAIPSGIKFIAGNSKSTSPQDLYSSLWECYTTDVPKNMLFSGDRIPLCKAGNVLRHTVNFPNCWDGVNLDTPDHKSHLINPLKGGACPSSHPVKLPNVSFKEVWQLKVDADGWRLSSDNYDPSLPGGYSAHGDWFEGWNPEIRSRWFRNCTSQPKDCGMGNLGDGFALARPAL